jgi:hypothetical protein
MGKGGEKGNKKERMSKRYGTDEMKKQFSARTLIVRVEII